MAFGIKCSLAQVTTVGVAEPFQSTAAGLPSDAATPECGLALSQCIWPTLTVNEHSSYSTD